MQLHQFHATRSGQNAELRRLRQAERALGLPCPACAARRGRTAAEIAAAPAMAKESALARARSWTRPRSPGSDAGDSMPAGYAGAVAASASALAREQSVTAVDETARPSSRWHDSLIRSEPLAADVPHQRQAQPRYEQRVGIESAQGSTVWFSQQGDECRSAAGPRRCRPS
jgi:hypothetical protein